jgi:hypothetical protein
MSERKPFLLRLDPDLWADLEAWAQAELRSVNGQIEYLLRQAVQKRRGQKTGMADTGEFRSRVPERRYGNRKR